MKRLVVMLWLFNALVLSAQQGPEGYQLVWSDEFDSDGTPNPNNWMFEEGFVRNQELQWYQSENAWCEDGFLIIEGRREKRKNPNYIRKSDSWKESRKYITYTSSSLKTKGLQSFQYGIIEVRAKIITEAGLWPAIWTLGVEGGWPSNGECDILEFYDNLILANFAFASEIRHQPIWDALKKPISDFPADFDKKFHIWRLTWTEERMAIYLDDQLMNDIDLNETINQSDGRNPFRQPHYLLLNLAIGSNGGDPSKTDFPSRYLIDYVRVYQKNEP